MSEKNRKITLGLPGASRQAGCSNTGTWKTAFYRKETMRIVIMWLTDLIFHCFLILVFTSTKLSLSLSHSLRFETRSSRSYKSPLDLNFKTSTNLDFTKWLHSSTWSVSVSDRYFCFLLFCFCSLFFSPVPPQTVIKHSLKPNSFLLEEEC